MRLQQLLDEICELLQAESEGKHFKSIGALRKSQFQNDKSEDELFLRHDMYAGTIGNAEAAKKGGETKKNRPQEVKDAEYQQAAKKRADWYKDPNNRRKFAEALAKRDKKKKSDRK